MMFSFVVCLAVVSGANPPVQPVAPSVTSATVADLALHYRVDLYNTFRTQRAVYDRLARAGQATLRVSQQIPADSPQQGELASWFRHAHDAVIKGSAEVPAVPEVDPRTLVQVNSSADVTTAVSTQPAAPRAAAPEPPASPVGSTLAEISGPRSLLGSLEKLFSQGQTTLTGAMSSAVPDSPATSPLDQGDADPANDDLSANGADALQPTTLDRDDTSSASSPDGATASTAAAPSIAERVDQLQQRRAALTEQLAPSAPLTFDQAVELLLRVKLLDTSRNALAIELAFAGKASQGDFVREEGFTRDLFDTLRKRIAGDAFQGTAEQRRDLIEQIDGLLSDEDLATGS